MGEFFSCLAAFSVPRSMVDPLLSLVSVISMRSKSMIVIGSNLFHSTFSPARLSPSARLNRGVRMASDITLSNQNGTRISLLDFQMRGRKPRRSKLLSAEISKPINAWHLQILVILGDIR